MSAKCAVNINQIQISSIEMFLKMILVFFDFRKLKMRGGGGGVFKIQLTAEQNFFGIEKIIQLLLSDLEKRKTLRGKSWDYLFQKYNQLRFFFSPEDFPGHTTRQ